MSLEGQMILCDHFEQLLPFQVFLFHLARYSYHLFIERKRFFLSPQPKERLRSRFRHLKEPKLFYLVWSLH